MRKRKPCSRVCTVVRAPSVCVHFSVHPLPLSVAMGHLSWSDPYDLLNPWLLTLCDPRVFGKLQRTSPSSFSKQLTFKILPKRRVIEPSIETLLPQSGCKNRVVNILSMNISFKTLYAEQLHPIWQVNGSRQLRVNRPTTHRVLMTHCHLWWLVV